MKKIFLSILIFVQLICNAEKKFVWLYELEGTEASYKWDNYPEIHKKNNTVIIGYPTDRSINQIANFLYESHLKNMDENDKIILIAQGMGGLVARSLKNLSNSVIGIITLGTPHNGLELLSGAFKGEIINLFSYLTEISFQNIEITTHIFDNHTNSISSFAKPIIHSVNNFNTNFLINSLSDLTIYFDKAMRLYGSNYVGIYDLIPNSSYLRNINERTLDIPLINIYGSEDGWPVLRALSSLHKIKKTKCPAFKEKKSDKMFFHYFYLAMSNIREIQQAHITTYNTLTILAGFNPQLWVTREKIIISQNNWDRIYRYIGVDIHCDFAINTGAIQFKYLNYNIHKSTLKTDQMHSMRYLPFILKNDGFSSIPDMEFKGNSTSSVINIQVEGVNQMEIQSHQAIRLIMHRIFNEKIFGEVFSN